MDFDTWASKRSVPPSKSFGIVDHDLKIEYATFTMGAEKPHNYDLVQINHTCEGSTYYYKESKNKVTSWFRPRIKY